MKRLWLLAPLLCTPLVAGAQQPLNVWIKMPATISQNGMASGATNLPDGTILAIGIMGPPGSAFNSDPACDALGGPTVAVSHGRFGPVGLGGTYGCLKPGPYFFEIIMRAPFMQPANVITIIGKNGSNLTGPLVSTGTDGSERDVQARIPVEVQ